MVNPYRVTRKLLSALAVLLVCCGAARCQTLLLKDGRKLQGKYAEIGSIAENPLSPKSQSHVAMPLVELPMKLVGIPKQVESFAVILTKGAVPWILTCTVSRPTQLFISVAVTQRVSDTPITVVEVMSPVDHK